MGEPVVQEKTNQKEEEAQRQPDEEIAMEAIAEEETEDQRAIQEPSREFRGGRNASDQPADMELRPRSRKADRHRIASKDLNATFRDTFINGINAILNIQIVICYLFHINDFGERQKPFYFGPIRLHDILL